MIGDIFHQNLSQYWFPSTTAIGWQFSLIIILRLETGAFFLDEYKYYEWWNYICLIAGCVIVLGGLCLLIKEEKRLRALEEKTIDHLMESQLTTKVDTMDASGSLQPEISTVTGKLTIITDISRRGGAGIEPGGDVSVVPSGLGTGTKSTLAVPDNTPKRQEMGNVNKQWEKYD